MFCYQDLEKSVFKFAIILVREPRASGNGEVPTHQRTADREECDNAAQRYRGDRDAVNLTLITNFTHFNVS
jgi:hypothetical protein